RDDAGHIKLGADPSSKAHLFVRDAEVWLARCPWWFGLDAGWCHEWVSAELYPSSTPVQVEARDPPGFRDTSAPSFTGAPPADVKITVKDAGPGKPPSLVCERGNARAIFAPEEDTVSHISAEWTWIPESTSLYLANVTYDNGESAPTRTYLMKACESKP